MSIKIRRGDIEIEVEVADLGTVLASLGAAPVANGVKPDHDPNERIESKLLRIRSRLKSQQQERCLELLATSTDGLTDVELVQQLGLRSNSALAGIMGAISKYAKYAVKEGTDYSRVIDKKVRKNESGGREYRYRLTPEMRDIMRDK
jgi:hypothetical protein